MPLHRHQRRASMGPAGGREMGPEVCRERIASRAGDRVHVDSKRHRLSPVPGNRGNRHAGNPFHVQGNADVWLHADNFRGDPDGSMLSGAKPVQTIAASKGLRGRRARLDPNAIGSALGRLPASRVVQGSSAGRECENSWGPARSPDYGNGGGDGKAFRGENPPLAPGGAGTATRGNGEFGAGGNASTRKHQSTPDDRRGSWAWEHEFRAVRRVRDLRIPSDGPGAGVCGASSCAGRAAQGWIRLPVRGVWAPRTSPGIGEFRSFESEAQFLESGKMRAIDYFDKGAEAFPRQNRDPGSRRTVFLSPGARSKPANSAGDVVRRIARRGARGNFFAQRRAGFALHAGTNARRRRVGPAQLQKRAGRERPILELLGNFLAVLSQQLPGASARHQSPRAVVAPFRLH